MERREDGPVFSRVHQADRYGICSQLLPWGPQAPRVGAQCRKGGKPPRHPRPGSLLGNACCMAVLAVRLGGPVCACPASPRPKMIIFVRRAPRGLEAVRESSHPPHSRVALFTRT